MKTVWLFCTTEQKKISYQLFHFRASLYGIVLNHEKKLDMCPQKRDMYPQNCHYDTVVPNLLLDRRTDRRHQNGEVYTGSNIRVGSPGDFEAELKHPCLFTDTEFCDFIMHSTAVLGYPRESKIY